MKIARWLFWGSEHYSAFMLKLVGIVCLCMIPLMAWAWYEKANRDWPEEAALESFEGQVVSITESSRSLEFELSDTCGAFRWRPLYGRNWKEVEAALRQMSAQLVVKFEAGKVPFCGTRDVLALTSNGRPVLTYQRSQETYKADGRLMPIIFGLFLLGGPYCFWAARLKRTGQID